MARGGRIHKKRLSIRTYGERNPMISFMIVLCIFGLFGVLCQNLLEKKWPELVFVIVSFLLWGALQGFHYRIKGLAIKNKWHLTSYIITMVVFGTMEVYVILKSMYYSDLIHPKQDSDFYEFVVGGGILAYQLFVGVFFFCPLSLLLRGIIRNFTRSSGYNKRYWYNFKTIFKAHSNVCLFYC